MKFVHAFLICAAIGLSAAQAVRQLEIYTEETVITNFHLAEDETLEIVYYVDPISLEFRESTLRRIPTGLFSRNSLEQFVANDSLITEISASDFTNAVSLSTLDLSHNLITKLDANLFQHTPSLRFLILNFNYISEVDANAFVGLGDTLSELELYGNNLASLPATVFNPLLNLRSLDLGFNQISEFTFSDFSLNTMLRYFYMEFNELTSLENIQLLSPSIRVLFLFGNKIERIPNDAFIGLQRLRSLNLANNNIKEIGETSFSGLRVLLTLRLFLNEIEYLPPGVFQPLGMVNNIDLGSNAIKEISFATFQSSSATNLFLEDNQLENFDINILVSMSSLSTLHLHTNQLQRLNLDDAKFLLPNLTTISVYNNDFECRELSRIIQNMRQHEITSFVSDVLTDTKTIRLDGIGCSDNGPVPPPQDVSSNRRDIQSIQAEKLKIITEFDEQTTHGLTKRSEIGARAILRN